LFEGDGGESTFSQDIEEPFGGFLALLKEKLNKILNFRQRFGIEDAETIDQPLK
jgi:hypothetical protein